MDRPESPTVSVSRRGSVRGEDDCTVVWVGGEHDLSTKGTVSIAVARAAQLDDAPLLVDLSRVTFMDASTVSAIVWSLNRLEARGRSFGLRSPSPAALRVLQLCGLGHLVHHEQVGSTGSATALGTWVDVPPIPARGTDREPARVRARPKAAHTQAVLASEHAGMEPASATIPAHRAGP